MSAFIVGFPGEAQFCRFHIFVASLEVWFGLTRFPPSFQTGRDLEYERKKENTANRRCDGARQSAVTNTTSVHPLQMLLVGAVAVVVILC